MDTHTQTPGPAGDGRWDQAVSARLSKLRTMPVETARLERLLNARIAPAVVATKPTGFRLLFAHRPLRAVAASVLLIAATIAVLAFATSGGPVLASPGQMAQMHEDLVSGRMKVVQVDSVEAANRVLSEQSPEVPAVPDLPKGHDMACCMKSMKGKKLACVLLRREGVPVSLVVAHSRDVRAPAPTGQDGTAGYRVHSAGRVNVVMTERDDRWVCLMGELPADRLIDLAGQLRF